MGNGERVRKAKMAEYALFAREATKAMYVGTWKELKELAQKNGDGDEWVKAFGGKKGTKVDHESAGWEDRVYEEDDQESSPPEGWEDRVYEEDDQKTTQPRGYGDMEDEA